MTQLILKSRVEIYSLIVTGILLLGFIVATIILAIKLHNHKNLYKIASCDQCQTCAKSASLGLEICCTNKQGKPSIDENSKIATCIP